MDKSRCFDFGDFLTAKDVADNLGIDVGIIPYFWGDIRMRDHDDSNGIWAEIMRMRRSRVSDEALRLPNSSNHPNPTPSLSRFLQKLELRSGKNAEVLRDHLKQLKLKMKGFGVDHNAQEVVTVVVSSFTGSLGNWAAAMQTRF